MMTKIAIGLGLLAAACSTDDGLDDGRDDAISLGGKGDGSLTVTPGELTKIFQTASLNRADSLHDQVGLSTRAAAALDLKATGSDGHRGSIDDTYFSTLAQLDAVPYIGPYAMRKLKDYVHSAGIVDDAWSDKWSVQSQIGYTIPRSNDPWDSEPAFAVDRDGKLVALYQVEIHKVVLSIDDQVIDLPVADQTVAYQELRVAVDETNAIHVFYQTSANGIRFKHMTYKAGQWEDRGMFDGYLRLASNGAGAIYGLVRGQRWVASQLVDFTELHHFASTAAASSVETLPATSPMFSTDPAAIGVAADGLPVITWLHGTCKDRACPVESLQLLRRGATGFTSSSVAGDPLWSRSVTGLLTGGGPNATVVMSTGTTFDGATRIFKESAGTFVTGPAVTDQGMAVGVGWLSSAVVDAQGTLHGCGKPQSTAWLNELEVDGTGASTGTPIMNGGETSFCTIVLGASQDVHLVYGNRSVFLHATRP